MNCDNSRTGESRRKILSARAVAHDPWSLGAVGALLFVVAVAASTIPALRAARVDPTVALRAD